VTFPTIKLGLGQDAAADAEAVLLIADVEGRDGGMVGDLSQRHCKGERKGLGIFHQDFHPGRFLSTGLPV
jgi:hypothetical protein